MVDHSAADERHTLDLLYGRARALVAATLHQDGDAMQAAVDDLFEPGPALWMVTVALAFAVAGRYRDLEEDGRGSAIDCYRADVADGLLMPPADDSGLDGQDVCTLRG